MADKKSQPVIFVIFGGTGDLNWRKINPALFNLFLDGWMPNQFAIVGTGRSELSDKAYREKLLDGVNEHSRKGKADKDKWDEFSKQVSYQIADVKNPDAFKDIAAGITKIRKDWDEEPLVIYYMSVGPNLFPIIAENIKKNKLADDIEHSRIVVEKPFGDDLESAEVLNKLLCKLFDEKQIYRIDHFLGKEAVQNILAFRFANSILEPVWNRNYIEHVQISVTEQLGVGSRGGFYEGAGALRDMVQNHLMQLLCFIAMETPINFQADEVRNRKLDVLRSMRPFSSEDIKKNAVRGQYGPGWIEGKEVPGYRQAEDIPEDSNTETFAAVKFFIDNWRWDGVPFYVRTGKRLHQSASTISIQFRDVPHLIFEEDAIDSWRQNRLTISIQPEMSIRLKMQVKKPGLTMSLQTVDLDFNYDEQSDLETPGAYETLLLETIEGDQTLFMRGDEIEAAWELLMPILDSWKSKTSSNFPNYNADSWGPEMAEALIARDGFHWFSTPAPAKKSKE